MAYIYRNPFQQQQLNAQQQRAQLEAERQQATERLAWLNQQIAALDAYIQATATLTQNDPAQFLAQAGLANLCRMALDAYGQWVSAQQVRGYLNQLGITLDYTNEMAVLHTTLRRVGLTARDANGNTCYGKKGLTCPQGMWLV